MSDKPDAKRKAPFDLDKLSVPELTALIEAAEARRSEKMGEAKAALISEFREKAAQLGLPFESLLPASSPSPAPSSRKPRKDAGASLPAKYRSPTGETWSGRGRMPKWLSEAEKAGKNREEFRAD